MKRAIRFCFLCMVPPSPNVACGARARLPNYSYAACAVAGLVCVCNQEMFEYCSDKERERLGDLLDSLNISTIYVYRYLSFIFFFKIFLSAILIYSLNDLCKTMWFMWLLNVIFNGQLLEKEVHFYSRFIADKVFTWRMTSNWAAAVAENEICLWT